MTFFEYWCTWGVCMAGAGVTSLAGFAWENRAAIVDSFLRLIGEA